MSKGGGSNTKWVLPAVAGAALIGAIGVGVYFLVRPKPAPATRCTAANCAVPFSCQGSPAQCLIDPTNRSPSNTMPVPRDSNTAKMLGFQADAGTYKGSRAGVPTIADAEGIFDTPPPTWTFITNGQAVTYNLQEWSYDATDDLLQLTLLNAQGQADIFYLRWVDDNSFYQLTSPTDPNPVLLTRLTGPWCDPRVCLPPFLCDGTPGNCVINPANRQPGETEPVPQGSNTALMLGLLLDPARWIQDVAQSVLWETGPIFGTPLQNWVRFEQGTPVIYNVQFWFYYYQGNDMLGITVRDPAGAQSTFFMRYVSPTSWEYRPDSPDFPVPVLFVRQDDYCGGASCVPPFLCAPGQGCQPDPTNRAVWDYQPILRASPAGDTLALLWQQDLLYVDQATQTQALLFGSLFATPPPVWTLVFQGANSNPYEVKEWSLSQIDPTFINVNVFSQGTLRDWRLKYNPVAKTLTQIDQNGVTTVWIPHTGSVCDPTTCQPPFVCDGGLLGTCVINPTNRQNGDTAVVPQNSGTARMLGLLLNAANWLNDPDQTVFLQTSPIFGTPLQRWLFFNAGYPIVYNVQSWLYYSASDLLGINTLDAAGANQTTFYLRYVSPTSFEYLATPDSTTPLLFVLSAPDFCGPASCGPPFICVPPNQGCQPDPTNRAPGDYQPIERASPAGDTLFLLWQENLTFVDQATQTKALLVGSLFATPAPAWKSIDPVTGTRTLDVKSWAGTPAPNTDFITVNLFSQGSFFAWRLKYNPADDTLTQIDQNDITTIWIGYSGDVCDPNTCQAPFSCQGIPPKCLINPANRDGTDTDRVPQGSNAASMLAVLSSPDRWVQDVTPDSAWDITASVFQTIPAPPSWTFYQASMPGPIELLNWSYNPTANTTELLLLRFVGQPSLFFRWIDVNTFQTTANPSAAGTTYKRSPGYCGPATCSNPFTCQSGSCLINPANRKPGETTAIPRNSNTAKMLKLISSQAQWIGNGVATGGGTSNPL